MSWDASVLELLENGYHRGINLALWISFICCLICLTAVYLYRAKKEDLIISQRWMFRSFSWFFLFITFTRILYIFAYWYEDLYNLLKLTAYLCSLLSVMPLILTIENYIITKTKRFFSILSVILTLTAIIFLFMPEMLDLAKFILQIGATIMGFIFLILYLMVMVKTTGIIRKKTFFTFIGLAMFSAALLIGSEVFLGWGVPINLPPIIYIAGVIIVGLSQKIE
ncbi:MAG: hypothetical protein GF364_06185 [Candidatus Lokiarchaeota archaeon]|nr:hypothetical protein [Candidatus Lokiarchaeota archaeon]